jgi:molybdopterin molybdotransferase
VTRKIVSEIGRVDYCRVRVTASGIEPVALSGAAMLSSTTRADGFVIVPSECEGYGPGAEVDVFLYDGPGSISRGSSATCSDIHLILNNVRA